MSSSNLAVLSAPPKFSEATEQTFPLDQTVLRPHAGMVECENGSRGCDNGMQRIENVSENVQYGTQRSEFGFLPNSNVLAAAEVQTLPRDENYDHQLERLRNFELVLYSDKYRANELAETLAKSQNPSFQTPGQPAQECLGGLERSRSLE